MDEAIARYPTGHRRSAAMPLLHLWQEHFGFISDEAIFWIAEKLGLQPINILEVVTFYPMFRQHPAGKTHIRICRTLSCAMAGGLEVMENLCASLGIQRPRDGEERHNPIAVSADGTDRPSARPRSLRAERMLRAAPNNVTMIVPACRRDRF